MATPLSAGRRRKTVTAALIGGATALAVTAPAAAAPRFYGIPFTTATVSDRSGSSITVDWAAPDVSRVRVYADGRYIGQGRGAGHLMITAPSAARETFQLVPDRGLPLVVAERTLGLGKRPQPA